MSPFGVIDHLQNEILEALARGIDLKTAADRICRAAELSAPGTVCSILTVDEQGRLHPLAAPSLPDDYSHALERFQEQLANADANGEAPIPVVTSDRAG